MRLTKQQRNVAYILALCELEEYRNTRVGDIADDGFCCLMFNLFDMRDLVVDFRQSLAFFPEIRSKKPDWPNFFGLWWECNRKSKVALRKRIEVLKKCIKETSDW